MSHRAGRKHKKNTEPLSVWVFQTCKVCLGWYWDAYLLLLLVCMPFYFTRGYASIGTDKFRFLKACNVRLGWILAVLLLIWAVSGIAAGALLGGEERGRHRLVWTEREVWKKRLAERFSVMDLFALLYLAALLFSYEASAYQEIALWGASGWYMGLGTQGILLLTYFGTAHLRSPSPWVWYAGMSASAVVFLLGILDRFGCYLLDMESRTPLYISTIGNINWFCGYLVCMLFFGMAGYCRGIFHKRWQRKLLYAYCVLGFLALFVQGSSGGMLAFFGALVVLVGTCRGEWKLLERLWQCLLGAGIAMLLGFVLRIVFSGRITYTDRWIDAMTTGFLPFLVTAAAAAGLARHRYLRRRRSYHKKSAGKIARRLGLFAVLAVLLYGALVALHTAFPAAFALLPDSLFTFSPQWGSKRGATWKAGIMCFWEQDWIHRIFGVGPDCMYMHILMRGSDALRALVSEQFGNAVLTNAHCEWLTVLVDTGLLGLAGYAGMMLSAIWRFVRAGKKEPLVFACGIALTAYTIGNIVSFQQVMNVTLAYILMGLGENNLRASRLDEQKP